MAVSLPSKDGPPTPGTCPKIVNPAGSWRGHRCERDLKTDEQRQEQLCGIHLAAKKRRESNDVKHAEERAKDRVRRAEEDHFARKFAARTGLKITVAKGSYWISRESAQKILDAWREPGDEG